MAVRDAVDDESARTAHAFATVVVERDRPVARCDQILVQHIEHFEKGHVRADVLELVGLETTLVFRVALAPYMQG